MLDFILLLLVLIIFLAGVQVGAWYGSLGVMIRKFADWLESKLTPEKKDAKKDDQA